MKKRLTPAQIRSFRKKVLNYYASDGRDLPWRKKPTPYRVLISEIMLQQTQVERVIGKYPEFLAAFPDFNVLACAPLPRLLGIWRGMGYNRRALALKALAQKVVDEHHGKLPREPEQLITLPGIGPYTAGAIAAFAFNQPAVFMDTNIRRVYLHEFFRDRENIRDSELTPLVEQTLDTAHPRKWYNALMDYGAMLKRKHANPNRKSAHYTRQDPFENSNRQARGSILNALITGAPLTQAQLAARTGLPPERIQKNLLRLENEGFLRKKGRTYVI